MVEELKKERLDDDIHVIKNNLTTFGLKLELVYAALTGNEISKDEGLVGEIKQQKLELQKLTIRVEIMETKERKRQIYVNIIYAAVGVIMTVIFEYFIKK
jgi:hypothetical protein